ncbi:MAG TPA: gamma-glutamylcyclotransferase family protein [Solirubrobacterales bacterium]|nr:gamma-glutamylcyclotransferase family protein [Solirubrobacterales bacterium]
MSLGLFGYGSLVLSESAAMTLGRRAGEQRPARLHDWRRRFSQRRDNLTCEKTFECDGGWRPEWILGLNVEEGADEAGPVNGVVIELTEAELDRLDIREIRYDRVDVTGSVEGEDLPARIVTYKAKPFHFAPKPPEDSVILNTYAQAVETGFEALGPGELDHYRATTPYPVERVAADLVIDRIPEGIPRAW